MVSTQTEMGSHVISAAHVAARFGRIVRRSPLTARTERGCVKVLPNCWRREAERECVPL